MNDETDESSEIGNLMDTDYDFDFESIDGCDDMDADSLCLLIRDRNTDEYGWHWIYRDTLIGEGLYDLAGYGLPTDEDNSE